MTPSCKWPIQQEKIDVDHQVTRPREIYFGDGVGLLWKTVRTSGTFLATSNSVFYKFKFKLHFFILYYKVDVVHFAEWIALKVYWREQRTIFSWQRLNTPLIFTGFKLHIMTTNLSWSSSKGTYSANPLTTVLGSKKKDQIATLLIRTLRFFDTMATRTSKKKQQQQQQKNKKHKRNNNNKKKPLGLEGKTTTSHVHHTFFIHFFAVFCTTTTWNWPMLHFMEDINKDNEILFLFLNFDRDPRRVQKYGYNSIWLLSSAIKLTRNVCHREYKGEEVTCVHPPEGFAYFWYRK